ncbi:MAG TPA: glycosyltransferase family 4 protein [Candidatus Dormibacteraeota bacterium]
MAWFGHGSGRRADGLTSYSHEVVSALARRGVDVCFFSYRRDGHLAPVQRTVQLGSARFKTVTIPVPATMDAIRRELERFRPDVLHLSLSHSLLDARVLHLARARGLATVVTVHLPYAPVDSGRGRVLYALYRFHARALKTADRCIALSDDQRDLLLSVGCDPSRIDVVGNGVDTQLISPGPSQVRADIGARFVVTYIGRIDPEKRVPQLVEAFLGMGWPGDHALLIAGTGAREAQVRRMTRDAPQVRMLGLVNDRERCVDMLRGTDVFVLPSTAEGLSLSMLEAMAAGCAVIATDVAEDGAALGDAGIRIPREPLEPALTQALTRLHDDAALRAALGRRARQRALAAYSLHERIDTLLRVYGDLTCDRPAERSRAGGRTEEAAPMRSPA